MSGQRGNPPSPNQRTIRRLARTCYEMRYGARRAEVDLQRAGRIEAALRIRSTNGLVVVTPAMAENASRGYSRQRIVQPN
jgi:hypothetical protein